MPDCPWAISDICQCSCGSQFCVYAHKEAECLIISSSGRYKRRQLTSLYHLYFRANRLIRICNNIRKHQNSRKLSLPRCLSEASQPPNIPVHLANWVLFERLAVMEQPFAVEGYRAPMGFGLDYENRAVIPDDEMINVAVFDSHIVHDDKMIHRKALQNAPHFPFRLCRPGIPADIKSPFCPVFHARNEISALKYFSE